MTVPTTTEAVAPEVTPEAVTTVPLKLQDRCDGCGWQAFVRVSLLSSEGNPSELLLCGHHYAKNEAKLAGIAMSIQDERHRINEKPSSSPE